MASQHSNSRRPRRDERRRRGRTRGRNRLGRTVVLGTVAVVLALWWVARELDLDREQLLGYLGTSAVFVAGLIILSLAGAAALWLVKRLGRTAAQGRSAKKRSIRGA
jgi:protein-S-isoprenylcysteine O-methyltransferase Ste14